MRIIIITNNNSDADDDINIVKRLNKHLSSIEGVVSVKRTIANPKNCNAFIKRIFLCHQKKLFSHVNYKKCQKIKTPIGNGSEIVKNAVLVLQIIIAISDKSQ